MKKLLLLLVLLAFIGLSTKAQTAYITNDGDNTVSVINVATNTVSATIPVGTRPWGISVSPDGNKVYVANFTDNTISVISTATNSVTATITVGSLPLCISVSNDGNKVYVANYSDNTISVINSATNTISATIAVGNGPQGISISPDGSKAYVANVFDNTVSVINTASNTVTTAIAVGSGPEGVSVSPDGNNVYVTNYYTSSVNVINAVTNTVTDTITVGNSPIGVSISPDGSKLYVANNGSNTISVINVATNTVSATITVDSYPSGVSVSPDGSKVYVANAGSNTVSIINTNTNTVSNTITVGNNPYAAGISTHTQPTTTQTNVSCYGGNNGSATVISMNNGTPPYTYLWNTVPQQTTNTASGLTAGNYTATVTDHNGTIYSVNFTITQPSAMSVSEYIYPNPVCPNSNVTFQAWGDAVSYLWNFGDGSPTSNNQYATHAYTSTGSYPTWVKATNSCGNDTILYQTVQVENNLHIVIANINISPNPVCPNSNVTFQAWGDAVSYVWNFGDGSPTSNNQYTSHIYTSIGNYPVWVKMTNACGNDTILYQTVQVENNLHVTNANISISLNPVCPNTNVTFQAWGDASSYVWNFGDGSPTSNNQYSSHTYTSIGNYPVWVKMTNACGNDTILYQTVQVKNNLHVTDASINNISPNPVCPNDNVAFQASASENNFLWNFGDGTTSNNSYTNHAYTSVGSYTASVKITNGCGNDTILYQTVQVKNNLHVTDASINNISPNPACPGDVVNFNASGGNSFMWNFGDGSPTSNNPYPSHVYSSTGSYTVSVKITNGCGNDTSISMTVLIENNLHITNVYLYISHDSICPNNTVSFEADANASSYLWDFGDGSPVSHDWYAEHKYTTTGNYTASVTLTNGCGNDTTITQTIHVVNNANPNPNDYYFDAYPNESCPGDSIVFLIGPSGSGTYLWNFGDGTTASKTSLFSSGGYTYDMVKHKYSNTGNYVVNFTLTNECGKSFTSPINVSVGNNISINGYFFWDNQFPAAGVSIPFYAYGGSSYKWNFGDGTAIVNTTSSMTPVNHTYASTGTDTITVVISNSCGKTETLKQIINIGTVGILEKNYDNNFVIYPNPANDNITIESTIVNKDAMISIYNIQGELLLQQTMLQNKTNVNVSALPSGLYFVKVKTEKGEAVIKFVKE